MKDLIQILNTKVVSASTSKDEVQDDEKYIRTLGMDEDLVSSIDEEDLQYDIDSNGALITPSMIYGLFLRMIDCSSYNLFFLFRLSDLDWYDLWWYLIAPVWVGFHVFWWYLLPSVATCFICP